MASTEITPSSIRPFLSEIYRVGNEMVIYKAILNIFIIIFGTFGNSLILLVYWGKMRKTSTHVLVMGLAGVDLTVCLLRIRTVAKFVFVMAGMDAPPEILAVPGRVALAMSCVLTAFIACDRYDSVCRPYKRLFNGRRAKVALFVSFVVAFLLESPNILSWILTSLTLRKLSHTIQICEYLTILLTTVVCYGRVYVAVRKRARIHIGAVVVTTDISVPSISKNIPTRLTRKAEQNTATTSAPRSEQTASPNVQTPMFTYHSPNQRLNPFEKVPSLKPSSAWGDVQRQRRVTETDTFNRIPLREGKSGNLPPMRQVMQRKVTRMLFITSMMFLVTWLPYWIYIAVDLYVLNGGTIGEGVRAKLFAAAVLVPFNSVVNPIIYGLANSQFRKDCAVVFKKWHLCCCTK